MSLRRGFLQFLIFSLVLQANAFAAEPLFKGEGACTRSFVHRNRTYPLDSSRKLDGEGLRSVLKTVPQAEALLNDYQSRLKSSTIPAYTATVGVLMAIGGPIYANSLESTLGRRDTKYAFLLSGLFLTVASYAYGQFAIVQKEKVLEKTVNTYNDSVPEVERIRVEIAPLFDGSGGEIKTQVPF